jgi:hypothetical protein
MDVRKSMMPGETVRFSCGECNLVFDVCLAPQSEWPEIPGPGMEEEIYATCCPICGSSELRRPELPTHARGEHVARQPAKHRMT